MKGLIITLFGSLIINTNLTAENAIYRWVDPDGKINFGDKPVMDHPTVAFTPKPLLTTTFVKTKTQPISNNKHKQRRRTTKKRKEEIGRCELITKKILSLENKLAQKLPASKFDQYKSQLKQNNWEKIKYC